MTHPDLRSACFNIYEAKIVPSVNKKKSIKNTSQINLIAHLPCPLNLFSLCHLHGALPTEPAQFIYIYIYIYCPSSSFLLSLCCSSSFPVSCITSNQTQTHTKHRPEWKCLILCRSLILHHTEKKYPKLLSKAEAAPRVSGRRTQQQQRRGSKRRTRCLAAGYIYY